MICRVDDHSYRGRTVTVPVDGRLLARAVREGAATAMESADATTVTVRARRPHPVHQRVGHVHPEMGLRIRTALAEAARARGCSTALDDEIRATRERLQELSVPDVARADQRRAVATASEATERLRERVAETRGKLTAAREREESPESVAETFRDTARELSEAETSAAAARQNLARKREDARAARDQLARRMALEDDLANLRRRARQRLVDRLSGAYECALASVPDGPSAGADPFDADPVSAALAVARVADVEAPVVLAVDRFDSARAASAWLDAPVARVQ